MSAAAICATPVVQSSVTTRPPTEKLQASPSVLASTLLVGRPNFDHVSAVALRHSPACLLSRTVNIFWFCSPSRPSMARSSVDTLTSLSVSSGSRRRVDLAPRITQALPSKLNSSTALCPRKGPHLKTNSDSSPDQSERAETISRSSKWRNVGKEDGGVVGTRGSNQRRFNQGASGEATLASSICWASHWA
jgi:hypothetical protein